MATHVKLKIGNKAHPTRSSRKRKVPFMTTMELEKPQKGPRHRSPEETELITRAKDALMRSRGISEMQAHRCLQRISMDSSTPLVDVARQILALLDR